MSEERTALAPFPVDIVSSYLRSILNMIESTHSYGGQVFGKGYDGDVGIAGLVCSLASGVRDSAFRSAVLNAGAGLLSRNASNPLKSSPEIWDEVPDTDKKEIQQIIATCFHRSVNTNPNDAQPRLSGATLQCVNGCQTAYSAALEQCATLRGSSEIACRILATEALHDCTDRCTGTPHR